MLIIEVWRPQADEAVRIGAIKAYSFLRLRRSHLLRNSGPSVCDQMLSRYNQALRTKVGWEEAMRMFLAENWLLETARDGQEPMFERP